MLDLDNLDLGNIADALDDQFGGYEHLMLIDPQTGETVYWSADTGIDGNTPIALDELLEDRELVGIHPLPTWVWYQDMADFADGISDEQAGRRLERAIRGKGAFRRFKDELHQEYPDLLPAWYEFRDTRILAMRIEAMRIEARPSSAKARRPPISTALCQPCSPTLPVASRLPRTCAEWEAAATATRPFSG